MGETRGSAEMETVLDILCFGIFFFIPQKPESIKAIMLGVPDREGRSRALQGLSEAWKGVSGAWECG